MAKNIFARILFVCLGNICRSPMAEAVFRRRVEASGLKNIEIDSAGTGDWHLGSAPDPRAILMGETRGYDLSALIARQVTPGDFAKYTHILAMDRQNLADLQRLAPVGHTAELRLFLEYAHSRQNEVPDPYFGGAAGFAQMTDLIEGASDGLIAALSRT